MEFLCRCSFLEIYQEQIYDLLDSSAASLHLRENIKKGVFVDGIVEQTVSSASDAYQVLSGGWINRTVASTSMNRESSRSHAVFTVTIESKVYMLKSYRGFQMEPGEPGDLNYICPGPEMTWNLPQNVKKLRAVAIKKVWEGWTGCIF